MTDDTAAFTEAFAKGGMITLPGMATCVVSGQITIVAQASLKGDGPQSVIAVKDGFSDPYLFLISPAAGSHDGYVFSDFHIQPQTAGMAGPISFMFATTAAGQYLRQAKVERVIVDAMNEVSIASVNTNMDGIASFFVNECFLNGGIFLNNAGDSITIQKNVIWGPGIGVFMSQAPGANLLILEENNITNTGGGVYLVNARFPRIINNQFELNSGAYTGSSGALVYIQDSIGGTFAGNQMQSNDQSDGVYLLNTSDFHIASDNSIYTGATKYHYHLTSNSGLRRDDGNLYYTSYVLAPAKVLQNYHQIVLNLLPAKILKGWPAWVWSKLSTIYAGL